MVVHRLQLYELQPDVSGVDVSGANDKFKAGESIDLDKRNIRFDSVDDAGLEYPNQFLQILSAVIAIETRYDINALVDAMYSIVGMDS